MDAESKPWRAARPTEFRGVRYDSKSEAVFARALELAGNKWNYHPQSEGEHDWDFVVEPVGKPHRSSVLGYKTMYVEYKPAAPTDTYIEELTNSMRATPAESVIVWGSPWNGPVPELTADHFYPCCYYVFPVFSSLFGVGWGNFDRGMDNGNSHPASHRHCVNDIFGITEEIAQAAKLFRFDLRS